MSDSPPDDDPPPLPPPPRVRRVYVKTPKKSVEILGKTYDMLRAYCRENKSQIRSEIDGLLQFAIEERRKRGREGT